MEIDDGPPRWNALDLRWERQKAQCNQCGGDGATHINVAASVAKTLGIPFQTAMNWECRVTNAVSRALNALTWAQMGVDIDHCCCCEDHCQEPGKRRAVSGGYRQPVPPSHGVHQPS